MQLELGTPSYSLIDGSASWDACAADALRGWNEVLDAMQFQSVSGSHAARAAHDGVNTVFFSNTVFGQGFSGDVLAVTVIQSSGTVTTESDVIVNTAFRYNSYYGSLRHDAHGTFYDLHRILLHEFGHVIGLDHPDAHGQMVDSIMNSHISDNFVLQGDDILGVQARYSPRITSPLFASGKVGQRLNLRVTSNFQGAIITPNNLPPGLSFNTATNTIGGVPARAGTFRSSIYVMRFRHPANFDMNFTIAPGPTTLLTLSGPNGLVMAGEPGASVFGSSSYLFLPGDGTFTVTRSNMNAVEARFINSDNWWNLDFQAAGDVPLTVGEYDGAERDFVNDHPRLDVFGNGSGCNEVLGNFHVKAIAYGRNHQILSFCATFEQHCEGQRPASRGEVRFNYDPAHPPPTPTITSPLLVRGTQGTALTYNIRANKNPTAFRTYRLPDGLNFDPATARISGTPTHAGEFDVVLAADNASGTGTARLRLSIAQLPAPSHTLANISTRVRVAAGYPAISGFVIQGSAPKKVIVRVLGPSLSAAGITAFLPKPFLGLYDASRRRIAFNYRWPDTQWTEIENTGLTDLDFDDSVIVKELPPGAYTAVVQAYNNAPGIALVEVYDLDWNGGSRLANISTRGFVGTDDAVLIAGFILTGTQPTPVLIRAIGPDLTAAGVANALPNPALQLYDGNGTLIRTNDNWRATQASEILGTALAPHNNWDAAILATLLPGNYTAITRSVGNAVGVALVEVYNLH